MLTTCHVFPVLRDRKEIQDGFLLLKHSFIYNLFVEIKLLILKKI